MPEKNVLLVEDNPDDEILALRAFRNCHYVDNVEVARDGVQALEYLFGKGGHSSRNTDFQPTVIILDMKLPRLNGLDVLRRIRQDQRTRFIPVVMMTSSSRDSDIIAAYSLGANSYVQKPVNFDDFVREMNVLANYWLGINRMPEDTDSARDEPMNSTGRGE
ncbi:MAG: response regulator [Pseudomonadales bacterium]|nr:response regulator [Pseudomonadales bacterium]